MFVETDLLNAQSVQAAVDKAVQRFKRIDVLCNIAGVSAWARQCTRPSDRGLGFHVERERPHGAQHVPRRGTGNAEGRGGKIVNIGRLAAQKGSAQMGAYVASKSAVSALTETMGRSCAEKKHQCELRAATIIDTPETGKRCRTADPKRWVATGGPRAGDRVSRLRCGTRYPWRGAAVTGLS